MEIPVPVQPSWLRRASAPLPGFSAPGRLFDQRFGEGLLEAELAALCPAALAPYYLRAPSVALPAAQVPGLGRGCNPTTSKAQGSGHPERGEGMYLDFDRDEESGHSEGLPELPTYGILEARLLEGVGGPRRSEDGLSSKGTDRVKWSL